MPGCQVPLWIRDGEVRETKWKDHLILAIISRDGKPQAGDMKMLVSLAYSHSLVGAGQVISLWANQRHFNLRSRPRGGRALWGSSPLSVIIITETAKTGLKSEKQIPQGSQKLTLWSYIKRVAFGIRMPRTELQLCNSQERLFYNRSPMTWLTQLNQWVPGKLMSSIPEHFSFNYFWIKIKYKASLRTLTELLRHRA